MSGQSVQDHCVTLEIKEKGPRKLSLLEKPI